MLPTYIELQLREDNKSLNEHIDAYNIQAETLINKLNLKITKFIKQKISKEWDETKYYLEPEPMRYYTKRIDFEIGNHVKFRNKKRFGDRERHLGLAYTKDGVNRWKLHLESVLVASNNETEIIKLQKVISEMFDAVIDGIQFKKLNTFFEQIKEEHKLYQTEIKRVIRDLETSLLGV